MGLVWMQNYVHSSKRMFANGVDVGSRAELCNYGFVLAIRVRAYINGSSQ